MVAQRAGELLEWRAEREVIVCGGAYNSPQLLVLSGIGRPEELELLQIPLVAESPEVGMNLQDHPTAGVTWFCQDEISLKDALNDANLAQWMQGQGPLTSNIGENGGFVRTRDGLPAPDVQFHMVPVVFEEEGLLAPPAHGFTLSACVLKPQSRGMVAVTTPDPTAKPFIVHGYYTVEDDVRSGVAGLRMVMDFVRQAPLSRYARDAQPRPGRRRRRRARGPHAPVLPDHLPPGRHVPHGRRRRPPWSTRSCACAASRDCAWSTRRSCRACRAATPTRRSSRSPSGPRT